MRCRLVLLLFALNLLPGSVIEAQVDSQPESQAPTHRLHIAAGAHYSPVILLAGHVAVFPKARENPHGYSGWFLSLEPGVAGGLVGIGRGGNGGFAFGFLRAAILRTWGDPGDVAANQSFVGADLRIGIAFFSGGAGWYTRISGNEPGESDVWLFNFGIGF